MSMEFFRQEYWSGLPFPPPGHLPDPGFELTSASPALQEDSLPLSHQGSPFRAHTLQNYIQYPPTICKTNPVAMKDPKLLQPFRAFWPRDFRVTSPRHISPSLISLPLPGSFLPLFLVWVLTLHCCPWKAFYSSWKEEGFLTEPLQVLPDKVYCEILPFYSLVSDLF